MNYLIKLNCLEINTKYESSVKCLTNSGTLMKIKVHDFVAEIQNRANSFKVLQLGKFNPTYLKLPNHSGLDFKYFQYKTKLSVIEEIFTKYLKNIKVNLKYIQVYLDAHYVNVRNTLQDVIALEIQLSAFKISTSKASSSKQNLTTSHTVRMK